MSSSRARGGPRKSPDDKYSGKVPADSRQGSGKVCTRMPELPGAVFLTLRALQEGLKRPPRWSKRAPSRRPIGPRRPRSPPRGRRRLEDAYRRLQEASPEGPRTQQSLISLGLLNNFGVLT
eukprot:7489011-Pyramimonas_sp.AAC.1